MDSSATFKPSLVIFACENSAGLLAPEGHLSWTEEQYSVKLIKLPCGGNLDIFFLLKALEGSDGTAIIACQKQNCKYIRGNTRANQRVLQAKKLIQEIGESPERVQIFYGAANQQETLKSMLNDYGRQIFRLGPNRGKVRK